MSFICDFCLTEFKSRSSLNFHMQNAKFCLDIQGKKQQGKYKCVCDNSFLSQQRLDIHKSKCVMFIVQKNQEEKYEHYSRQINDVIKKMNIYLKINIF